MPNFETPDLTSANRRRQKAESQGDLSLSHWQGELHAHTATNPENPILPKEIIETRKGSNCGKIPLEILARYHSQEMKDKFLAITEHSRDADPKIAVSSMTDWFFQMYIDNTAWLKAKFGKDKNNLTPAETEEIKQLATADAKEVAMYGDERLETILQDIDRVSGELPIRIIKGVEANLKPDGTFDTPMVGQGRFELVNTSIHPNLDREAFAPIIQDPDKYSDLTIRGIQNPRTNIMAHIGQNCPPEVSESLRWSEIAQSALENKVAIEINLRSLMKFIYGEILDYQKFPKDNNTWRQYFEARLPELVPILSSENIRQQLKPYFAQGLKIAIDTDEHESTFIGEKGDFKERNIRFWRCLKMLEKYFNQLFDDLGIRAENIINTYSLDDLAKFVRKE